MELKKNYSKKVGEYFPSTQMKGVNEAFVLEGIEEGQLFWTVVLDKNGNGFDTLSHYQAITLSKLVKIEQMLKSKTKR